MSWSKSEIQKGMKTFLEALRKTGIDMNDELISESVTKQIFIAIASYSMIENPISKADKINRVLWYDAEVYDQDQGEGIF